MKYLIILFLCFIVACGNNPRDIIVRRASIMKEFGTTAEIQNLPDSFNCFIVRETDGRVWYIEFASISNTVYTESQIFPDPSTVLSKNK